MTYGGELRAGNNVRQSHLAMVGPQGIGLLAFLASMPLRVLNGHGRRFSFSLLALLVLVGAFAALAAVVSSFPEMRGAVLLLIIVVAPMAAPAFPRVSGGKPNGAPGD
jgi:hypothetical protein